MNGKRGEAEWQRKTGKTRRRQNVIKHETTAAHLLVECRVICLCLKESIKNTSFMIKRRPRQ